MPSLCKSQSGVWTWMGGGQGIERGGIYGIKGVPDIHNTPPGAYEAANWIDNDGNFWAFGGVGDTASYSDMWKYDPVINMWTWINGTGGSNLMPVLGTEGIPSPLNNPSCRAYGCLTWTDTSGDLWLYGGDGLDETGNEGIRGDLWRYNIPTNEWTWMGGPSLGGEYLALAPNYGTLGQASSANWPGWRDETNSCWVDDSDGLWLYGGDGNDFNLADMWRFNIGINEWVWMKGPAEDFAPGTYGTKGVENSSNNPQGRSSYTHWKDAEGNFYVYGGIDFTSWYVFNDVWRFNIATHNWTWIAGDDTMNSSGYYQGYCIKNYVNEPMGRFENRSPQVIGKSNILISFGGSFSNSPISTAAPTSDLWAFDPTSFKWTLLSGLNPFSYPGNYGTYQVPSPNNYPPVRTAACEWIDKWGNFWFWSGFYNKNDLWRFVPDCSCIRNPIIVAPPMSYRISDTVICQGSSAYLSLQNMFNVRIEPLLEMEVVDSNNYILAPTQTRSYTVYGQTAVCGPVVSAVINVHVLPQQVNVTANKSNVCSYDSARLCAPVGFSSYLWSSGDTSSCIYTHLGGIYNVTVSTNNCSEVSDNFSVHVLTVVSASISISGDTLIASDADDYQWYLNNSAIAGATSKTYLASVSGIYSVQITDSNGCTAVSDGQLNIYPLSDNHIKIFPNPTTTNWQIVVGPEWLGSEGEVYDELGRLIFKVAINNLQTTVDLGSIASAVYELRMTQSGYSVVKKLVKLQE